jgi:hypothetical protein
MKSVRIGGMKTQRKTRGRPRSKAAAPVVDSPQPYLDPVDYLRSVLTKPDVPEYLKLAAAVKLVSLDNPRPGSRRHSAPEAVSARALEILGGERGRPN